MTEQELRQGMKDYLVYDQSMPMHIPKNTIKQMRPGDLSDLNYYSDKVFSDHISSGKVYFDKTFDTEEKRKEKVKTLLEKLTEFYQTKTPYVVFKPWYGIIENPGSYDEKYNPTDYPYIALYIINLRRREPHDT